MTFGRAKSPRLELVQNFFEDRVAAELMDLTAGIQIQLDHDLTGVLERTELFQQRNTIPLDVQVFGSLSEYIDNLLIVRTASDGMNDGKGKFSFC